MKSIKNDHPISQLSSVSNLFDRIFIDKLSRHLKNNNVLGTFQHDLGTSKSTVTASGDLWSFFTLVMMRKSTSALFIDLSIQSTVSFSLQKSESLVSHVTLLTAHHLSQPRISQGSVLGRILFITYADDLHKNLSNLILLADEKQ